MVVLLVNKFFFPKGGSERYLFMQSDALAERGHEVVHFAMSHPDNRPSRWSSYFVSQRDYDDSDAGYSVGGVLEFIRSREAARNIERLVLETRPDVAHLHNIYHQITPSIIPVLRRHGIPVVLTLHDYKLVCPSYAMYARGGYCERCLGGGYYHAPAVRCASSFGRSVMLAIEAYWQRFTGVYHTIDRLLAPSRFMRETMIRGGFDADRVSYLPSFLPAVEGTPGDVPGGLPGDYILYFGRLSREKGLLTLLEAVSARANVALVVAGDGPLRPELEAAAARDCPSRVVFTGHLAKRELDGVVAAARAVVLPAEWPENAPFTVLEAAMQGVPVIVSDLGGLPEMAETVHGRVFPAGDAAALAAAIDAVWSRPDEARERAQTGRDAVLAHYDRTAHMETLESIYAGLADGVAG